MGDLIYLGILLVCCGATGALIVICDRLRPRDSNVAGSSTSSGTPGSSPSRGDQP